MRQVGHRVRLDRTCALAASSSSATPGTRSMPYAWQVRRSVLDEILFRHAAAQRRTSARRLPRHARSSSTPTACSAVRVMRRRHASGSWRARYVRRCHRAATRCWPAKIGTEAQEPRHTTARRSSATSRDAQRLPGQARRQHQHLLVRPRLVLVHSAGRRQHQRRRGVLALLPEVARQAAARVLRRHDRAVPGAGRAAAATPR